MLERWRHIARQLKRELTIYKAIAQDPRTPWFAKVLLLAAIGYVLLPFDLIPDWIPVLGYVDDIVLVPLGIWLALKCIPPPVMAECRQRARSEAAGRHSLGALGAGLVIVIWIFLAISALALVLR